MSDLYSSLTPDEQDVVVGIALFVAFAVLAAVVQAAGTRRARHRALRGRRSQSVWSVLVPFVLLVALVLGWPWLAATFGGVA